MSKRSSNSFDEDKPAKKRKSRFSTKSSTADDKKPLKKNAASSRAESLKASIQAQMSSMKDLLEKQKQRTASLVKHNISNKLSAPAPLVLDAEGRQIDPVTGKVMEDNIVAPTTLKANQAAAAAAAASSTSKNPYLAHLSVDKDDRNTNVDPRLKIKMRSTKASKSLKFVQEGTYVKAAEAFRNRQERQAIEGKIMAGYASGRNPKTKHSGGIVDGVVLAAEDDKTNTSVVPLRKREAVPDVEWWDLEFLSPETQDIMDKFGCIKASARKENPGIKVTYEEMSVKHCETWQLIEHTARIKSIIPQSNAPVAIPLMLTAAERKRIRRTNRADREKEKQDKVALGLLPTPEPKVKLANMMRVLQEQAVADPSAVEKKVRAQVAQRIQNHEMRNQARKLTPEERRAKNAKKMKEDASGLIHVAVFKVRRMSDPKIRFKVDVNAQQWQLTGGVLICNDEPINLVVVEGGRKAIKGYVKLMTRRIDWNAKAVPKEAEEQKEQEVEDDDTEPNTCDLVWQGEVARRSFNTFRFQDCRTAATARKVMEAKHVAHYWDMVYNNSTLQQ